MVQMNAGISFVETNQQISCLLTPAPRIGQEVDGVPDFV